ncbi:hypothetical protein BBM40_21510 [Vibrio parahaemolyticus]|uniref:hypothetical protein n=1 Tax=Vibrio parahaemolyticus TaxID=670 RepID=UPI00084B7E8C|nr:hypothetical protein [Vibrio parahaemolyticus]EJS9609378.1 hypothetical protein [Vibrio parahaemolyticus]MCX8890709.1 hypothetical protein [Vibrio parahaemolyticus]MDG2749014.1 hypothetical protein [Vibrio parahaemolyticus]ODZ44502.1 hypothetical protein BBM40_21510 [Vibrio parahaemolyticus]HCG7969421.1 hypothetical protein [Vibrio parahaemolyticus]
MEYLEGNKYDALKLRFTDQVSLLVKITELDLKIFSGYITVQLALGAWLITKSSFLPVDTCQRILSIIGLLIIDTVLSGIAATLLYNNYMRRREIIATVKNLNSALGYNQRGVYIESPINAETKFRPWWWSYLLGIFCGYVGIAVVLFGLA